MFARSRLRRLGEASLPSVNGAIFNTVAEPGPCLRRVERSIHNDVANAIEIWHIAIPVTDLERSVSFYCGNLGFELAGRDQYPTMKQAFVSLGKSGFTLELFVPLGEEADKPRRPPDHLAFECQNIEDYRARVIGSGFSVPEIETFPGGMKHFELRDPDGVKLDFFQGRLGYDTFISSNK